MRSDLYLLLSAKLAYVSYNSVFATIKPSLKGFSGCPLNKSIRTKYKIHYKWPY